MHLGSHRLQWPGPADAPVSAKGTVTHLILAQGSNMTQLVGVTVVGVTVCRGDRIEVIEVTGIEPATSSRVQEVFDGYQQVLK